MTWLLVLVTMLMLLVMVQASEDADAETWSSDYAVRTDSANWQRLDVDGDSVYVVYIRSSIGTWVSFLRFHNGTAWSTELAVSGTQTATSQVEVAADNGIAHVLYVDWSDGDGDIYYTAYNGVGWSRSSQVSSVKPGVDAEYPDIDVEDGTVHVVWNEDADEDGDKDVFYRSGNGIIWSDIDDVPAVDRGTHQDTPSVTVADGDVHVTWRDRDGSDFDVMHRMFNGTHWGIEVEVGLAETTKAQYWPQTVVTAQGAHVFYTQIDTGGQHTYMRRNLGGTWVPPEYVGASRMSGDEVLYRVAAEKDHMVITYSTNNNPTHVIFRHYTNGWWQNEETVVSNPAGLVRGADVDLVNGIAHVVYNGRDSGGHWYNTIYTSASLDNNNPVAWTMEVVPYWMNGTTMNLSWEAQDSYWLSSVTVQYRYSTDNATWDRWTVVRTVNADRRVAGGLVPFTPSDGDGFYEFKAYAIDLVGKSEDPSIEPESMAGLDTTDPTGSIVINGGDEYTGNSTVTLTLTYGDATSGVAGVRFAEEAVGGDEPWDNPLDTKEWDIGTTEGEYTVAYQVMDASGRLSRVSTASIFLDTADPEGTITINGGNEWSNSNDVSLDLTSTDTGSGITEVRFANEAIGGDEPWENPLDTKAWTLPEGDGPHQVAYQVIDAAGRTSPVYLASINLDTVAPTGSIIMGGGDTLTSERTVTLSLTYDDVTSGVAGIRFSEEAVGGDEPWDNPVETKEWELSAGSGLKTIYYQVRDVSGLVSEVYSVSITLDAEDPTGAITLSDGVTLVNTATVDLALTFDDATSNIVGIRISEEAVGGDTPWENPVEALEFTLSAGDGQKTIYFQVRDEVGRESPVYSVSFTLDSSNPFVESTDPEDVAEKVALDKTISVRFSELMDKPSTEGAFSLTHIEDDVPNNVGGTFTWSPDGKTLTFTPLGDLKKGTTYNLIITTDAMDAAGNTMFPAVSQSFTTLKDGNGGNGGDGGDGDEDGLLAGMALVLIVAVLVVMVIVIGTLYYFVKFGGSGGGEED